MSYKDMLPRPYNFIIGHGERYTQGDREMNIVNDFDVSHAADYAGETVAIAHDNPLRDMYTRCLEAAGAKVIYYNLSGTSMRDYAEKTSAAEMITLCFHSAEFISLFAFPHTFSPLAAINTLREAQEGLESPISPKWGIDALDEETPLSVPLTSVIAPSGVAKTTMFIQAAHHTALAGIPSAMVSLEMPLVQLQARLARMISRGALAEDAVGRGEIDIDTLQDIEGQISPIMTMERPASTEAEKVLELVNALLASGVELVCVDHLQAVRFGGMGHRFDEASDFVSALYENAIRYNAHILLASQVRREAARSGRVSLSDAATTAGIEHKSDRVIALTASDDYADVIHATCLKNRFGDSDMEMPLMIGGSGLSSIALTS